MEEVNMSIKPTYTPGPWRWELNESTKGLQLVGGRPLYDLTVMDFKRWGMDSATVRMRDTAHDGMNIMHKLHDRRDWIEPYPGREHHARWLQNAIHPDMKLMAMAPELLVALKEAQETINILRLCDQGADAHLNEYAELIEKAEGGIYG